MAQQKGSSLSLSLKVRPFRQLESAFPVVLRRGRFFWFPCPMTFIRFGAERPVSWATIAALDFLSRNRHRRVRLEEVARHVGLSPWELDRRFKQEKGKGIGKWNEEDFWNHIGFRLWFFGESPKEVMCSVCCRDFAKFCHGFKRRFGVCPRVYQAPLPGDLSP